jgi:hypothetical protein
MRNSVLSFLFLALATGLSAAPTGLTAVAADAAPTGLMVYGRMQTLVLAADAAGLAGVRVSLQPGVLTYVAWLPRPEVAARVRRIAPLLLEDGPTALVQLDAAAAHGATLAGAELTLLPDRPRPYFRAASAVFPAPAFADTLVERLLARVSQDSIRRQIGRLADFRTRFSPAESCRAAEQYVFDYFTSLGFDSVQLDTFEHEGVLMRNVVATRLGRRNPEKIVIACGHMDCTSPDPWNNAPGAEDNASGAVMAIEAARVTAAERLDNTTVFIAFTGEEQGILGSFHYAEAMRARGADIVAALNFDMIAYEGGQFGTAIWCDTASLALGDFEARMADLYTTLDHAVQIGSYGSDQLAFQAYGFASTACGEYGDGYPWYHTVDDTLGNCSMVLAAEIAKMGIASLVTLALAPSPPSGFVLADAGTGATLSASWDPGTESDLAGYKLFWGPQPDVYTDSLTLGFVTGHNITGLNNGTRYFATVAAFDSGGHQGGTAVERSAVPGSVPLAPAGVTAMPFHFGVGLVWQPNAERDLAGYDVYRSTVSGSGYAKLNSALGTDTAWRDTGLLSDTMYYYVVVAEDTSGNESPLSAEVRSKPVTRDHGILLVDETRNGSGQRGSPSDAQQDAFYHALLRGFSYTDWDATVSGVPLAGDVGPYSTIVWHADDYTQQEIRPALPGLTNLLAQGGNLWLVGWKPVYGLYGVGRYPFTFDAGSFGFDQLHLVKGGQCEDVSFSGASGAAGYPNVNVDSTKVFSSFQGRLPFVDVLYPRDAEVVLTFNSAAADSFQDKPVGVRWQAGPGKVMACGFPLYYTIEPEARQLALKVLEDFGEPYGIEESGKDKVVTTKSLPTVVRNVLWMGDWGRETGDRAELLDVGGRRVLRLHPGANDLRGLAPGVYFLRVGAGAGMLNRKLAVCR